MATIAPAILITSRAATSSEKQQLVGLLKTDDHRGSIAINDGIVANQPSIEFPQRDSLIDPLQQRDKWQPEIAHPFGLERRADVSEFGAGQRMFVFRDIAPRRQQVAKASIAIREPYWLFQDGSSSLSQNTQHLLRYLTNVQMVDQRNAKITSTDPSGKSVA